MTIRILQQELEQYSSESFLRMLGLLKNEVKGYKGKCLAPILEKVDLVSDETISKDELDRYLKAYASKWMEEVLPESCLDMKLEQLRGLKEYSKQYATQIGLDLDAKENDDIDFNPERIDE